MNYKEKLIAICEGLGIQDVEILIETFNIDEFKDLGKSHLNYKTALIWKLERIQELTHD